MLRTVEDVENESLTTDNEMRWSEESLFEWQVTCSRGLDPKRLFMLSIVGAEGKASKSIARGNRQA
jgi:hypothetical protein